MLSPDLPSLPRVLSGACSSRLLLILPVGGVKARIRCDCSSNDPCRDRATSKSAAVVAVLGTLGTLGSLDASPASPPSSSSSAKMLVLLNIDGIGLAYTVSFDVAFVELASALVLLPIEILQEGKRDYTI